MEQSRSASSLASKIRKDLLLGQNIRRKKHLSTSNIFEMGLGPVWVESAFPEQFLRYACWVLTLSIRTSALASWQRLLKSIDVLSQPYYISDIREGHPKMDSFSRWNIESDGEGRITCHSRVQRQQPGYSNCECPDVKRTGTSDTIIKDTKRKLEQLI